MDDRFAWHSAECRFVSDRTAVLERRFADIDLDALETSAQTQRLLAPPMLGVLDTSFFHSAFKSQLANEGRPPLSLRSAQRGALRLMIADETLTEVFDKLDEFAESLGTTPTRLLDMLIDDWSPWVSVVDVAGVDPHGRAVLVAERDPTDRPSAVLASLLAPCLMLSTDKDFEPLGVPVPGRPVLAVQAALVLGDTAVRVQAVVMVPALPVAGVVGGVRWIGNRASVSPWLVAAALAGGGCFLYRRMSDEGRVAARKVLPMSA